MRWAAVSRGLAVPATGGAAIAIGAALAEGAPTPLPHWVPPILLAAGASALGGSLTGWLVRRRTTRRAGPAPLSEFAEEEKELEIRMCLHCSGTGVAVPAVANDPAPIPTRVPGQVVVYSSNAPGDQIWSSWFRTDLGEFPAPLVGPVAESAYAPPKKGAPIPFPYKEPDPTSLVPSNGRAAHPAPLRLREPYPLEELDRLFPPIAPIGSPTDSTPVIPGPAASGPFTAPVALPWEPVEPVVYDVRTEALTPIPPHLRDPSRSRAAREAKWSGRVAPRTAVVGSSACASCERSLTDLRRWSPCPDCLRPVCNLCLLESLWNLGRGCCTACLDSAPEMADGPAAPLAPWPVVALEDSS